MIVNYQEASRNIIPLNVMLDCSKHWKCFTFGADLTVSQSEATAGANNSGLGAASAASAASAAASAAATAASASPESASASSKVKVSEVAGNVLKRTQILKSINADAKSFACDFLSINGSP